MCNYCWGESGEEEPNGERSVGWGCLALILAAVVAIAYLALVVGPNG